MMRWPASRALLAAVPIGLVALATRVYNAFHYPPDWGYDGRFNWQYIHALTRTWALPDPDAGWATADPPLFYYLDALVWRALIGIGQRDAAVLALPLLSAALGLGIAALAFALVRRADPGNLRRALLAGGLVLFLPAHIQMSAMVNEGTLVALLVSLAVFGLAHPDLARAPVRRAVGIGLAAGLAALTQLSGALAGLVAVASYALDAQRRRALRPAVLRLAALGLAGLLAGGWYYARNWWSFGYLRPHALEAHRLMFSMPPGERALSDYLRVPLATFTDPQVLHPDLLRSVWGSTYASAWFDGHRFFLPTDSAAVRHLGTLTLLLALLPTAAFAIGAARGLRRARRSPDAVDPPLLLLVVLGLAGYAFYTWRNPWFAVVKGTTLLPLCLPFAYYASEVLEGWTRRGRAAAGVVWTLLAALALCATVGGAFNLVFERTEVSGMHWEGEPGP